MAIAAIERLISSTYGALRNRKKLRSPACRYRSLTRQLRVKRSFNEFVAKDCGEN
jgi:hypothetical protein